MPPKHENPRKRSGDPKIAHNYSSCPGRSHGECRNGSSAWNPESRCKSSDSDTRNVYLGPGICPSCLTCVLLIVNETSINHPPTYLGRQAYLSTTSFLACSYRLQSESSSVWHFAHLIESRCFHGLRVDKQTSRRGNREW